ncbi:MAG: hypothetical protein IPM69_00165 [Ignavibacteria bacterium]|nr:hypothetical protein [Ignavibacteria bacterium]
MTDRIQKTIFNKYLELVAKDTATESEISELLSAIKDLYNKKILTDSDYFRQKIKIVKNHLEFGIEEVKQKRKYKEVSLKISNEWIKILKDDLDGVDYSKTDLIDLEKIDNDKEIPISTHSVHLALKNLVIPIKQIKTEKIFEKYVAEQLELMFNKEHVQRQYNIGGILGLKSDIDVGNGQVGIELKIANNLSAYEMQRLVGQVIYYKEKFYKNKLLIYIVSKSTITPDLNELKQFLEELGTTVIFKTAINI